MTAARKRVVVVGAGFGGVAAVRRLAGAPVDVTLFDRTNHHLFQPLLYQVATAALAPTDIASPIRAMFASQPNVSVQIGVVEGVDAAAHTVAIRDVGPVPYDYLVLATGSESSWFGHDAWGRHATGLKSLGDASRIRERLLAAFEWAERTNDPAAIRRLLCFVVVGGGASGVELAGSIRELADSTLRRDFRRIKPEAARVLLFEGGDTLLAGFPANLSNYARQRLERMRVEVHTGTAVEAVDQDGVTVGGHAIESANVFWCAGVAATPAAAWLGIKPGKHGAVPVGPDCAVAGRPDVFVVGDAALMTPPLPGVAPVAEQQGRYVAEVIAAAVAGRTAPKPFRYRDQGSLAVIGRSAAVAALPFANLTGVVAWLMWGGVHLFLLNGLRNRVLVYVQWAWAWLTYGRGARLIEGEPPPE